MRMGGLAAHVEYALVYHSFPSEATIIANSEKLYQDWILVNIDDLDRSI